MGNEQDLPPDWLARQFAEVDAEIAKWPDGLRKSFEDSYGQIVVVPASPQPPQDVRAPGERERAIEECALVAFRAIQDWAAEEDPTDLTYMADRDSNKGRDFCYSLADAIVSALAPHLAASPAPADDVAALRARVATAERLCELADGKRFAAEAALAEARVQRDEYAAVVVEIAELLECQATAHEPVNRVRRLTADRDRLAEAADYLIDRYRRCHAGKKVRDLEEAEEAYKSARVLASLPEPEKEAG